MILVFATRANRISARIKAGYQVSKHQNIYDNSKPGLYGEIEIGDPANCGEVQITRRSTGWQFHGTPLPLMSLVVVPADSVDRNHAMAEGWEIVYGR
jgi:nitric oxide synthase oxygenase domain/subunit